MISLTCIFCGLKGHDQATSRRTELPQARSASSQVRKGHARKRAYFENIGSEKGADQWKLQGGGRNETALRALESRKFTVAAASHGAARREDRFRHVTAGAGAENGRAGAAGGPRRIMKQIKEKTSKTSTTLSDCFFNAFINLFACQGTLIFALQTYN